MRKFIALLVALTCLVGLVAGCGGGDDSKSQEEIASESQDATLLLVGRAKGVDPGTGASGIQYSCSAWVYDAAEGLVVTNAHCATAAVIQVGPDSTQLQAASVVAVDNRDDLAVVRTTPQPEGAELPLADTPPAQGETVYTLGYPSNGKANQLATPYQASEGTVTADSGVQLNVAYDAFAALWASYRLQNDNSSVVLNDLVQTSASTTHGGSGGPVLNDDGEVVGVTVAGTSEGNVNDAISLETLNEVLPGLVEGESISYIGMTLSAVPTAISEYFKADTGFLLISAITKNSPVDQQTDQTSLLAEASRKGYLLAITKVNGQNVETQQQLVNALANVTSGQEVRLTEYAIRIEDRAVIPFGTVAFTAP